MIGHKGTEGLVRPRCDRFKDAGHLEMMRDDDMGRQGRQREGELVKVKGMDLPCAESRGNLGVVLMLQNGPPSEPTRTSRFLGLINREL